MQPDTLRRLLAQAVWRLDYWEQRNDEARIRRWGWYVAAVTAAIESGKLHEAEALLVQRWPNW